MSFLEYLESNLPSVESFHPHFNEALAWVLKAGGKHFRAQLVIGTAKAINPLCDPYAAALAVELLHTYSLIHDDLPAMDNANLRRGVPTLHVKYDEVTAILAGDALNTAAFGVLANSNLPPHIAIKCIQVLSKNGGLDGMVIGQAIDCYFENKKLSLDELEFLHLHKTGALIAASMQIGAIVAGASDEESNDIYKAGLKLGLAFQIHDDIIDATSSSDKAGKPTNNDSSKNSFTNLLGVDKAIEARDELEKQIINQIQNQDVKELVTNLINKYLKG
ncbi:MULTISPECIES: polyprenyl synthetase family protein [Campylobacter]|uniref:Geranyl diphosphate synthase / farnesyl diphosphate synthase n=1 Tax=Campylobacter devanensis TaxID=3161138 RepID=A0A1X9SU91_9BACT|nr:MULTISPECIES: polyprenyl synthetase family protein [Campylobacter]ARQ99780.1 geranyl diphosphate synthase / farnesyl diphosphate synthase [Campylobacter lanienae]SUX03031.1 geranyltranstransferase [Campylobacter lanienae]